MEYSAREIQERTELARLLLASPGVGDGGPAGRAIGEPAAAHAPLAIAFPAGAAPKPVAPDPAAATGAALPHADVLAVTWTADEVSGLADVLTPGVAPAHWTHYDRGFADYLPKIRAGAPARGAHRLGSWCMTGLGTKRVLCFKSELHLNQDGIQNAVAPGQASLPVKDLFRQLIEEVKPALVVTVGTSGGVYRNHDLGDVVITRAAKFRLQSEFRNAPYNNQTYRSDWKLPTTHFKQAVELMNTFADRLQEPPLLAPTVRHSGTPFKAPIYRPDIKREGAGGIAAFHPILTTDYFEFGTSTNGLDKEGMAVEMGDAVLGMAIDEMKQQNLTVPDWLVIRNLSDPQINGALIKPLQVDFAVWYYQTYGYWTSVMSALATWAVVMGL